MISSYDKRERMTDSNANVNMIVNGAYHAGTTNAIMMAYSWAGKRFFKIKPPDLSEMDVEDGAKLTLYAFLATMSRNWLVKQGLPDDIIDEK